MSTIAASAFASALVALVALVPSARAQTGDFYKGKQISLVINYTAGGPTDTEARLLARHLPKHISGAPSIVVRNMGGAGGMIGVNWLGQVAPNDGMTLGYMTGVVGASAHSIPELQVDSSKFSFIAGVEGISVYYIRSDVGGGMKQPDDIMRQSNFWIGGLTPDSDKDLRLRAELDLLGLKYRYLSGYAGAAEARLALERGEIQMTVESMPTYRLSIEPSLVKTGIAIPVWYDTTKAQSGAPHPDAAGISALPFQSFYRKVKGAPHEDDELWKSLILLNEIGANFQRTIHFPPGAPQLAIDIMRKAFDELVEDEDYKRDAVATIKFVPRFSRGPEVERSFRLLLRPDPQIKAFLRDYIEEGKAMVGK